MGTYGHALGQSRIAAIEATGSVTLDQATAIAAALKVPVEVLLYEHPQAVGGAAQQAQLKKVLHSIEALREEVRKMIAATGPKARKG